MKRKRGAKEYRTLTVVLIRGREDERIENITKVQVDVRNHLLFPALWDTLPFGFVIADALSLFGLTKLLA